MNTGHGRIGCRVVLTLSAVKIRLCSRRAASGQVMHLCVRLKASHIAPLCYGFRRFKTKGRVLVEVACAGRAGAIAG